MEVAAQSVENREASGDFSSPDLFVRISLELAGQRGSLIATMLRDAGKSVAESDAEVSEAIDFARYYAEGLSQIGTGMAPSTVLWRSGGCSPVEFPVSDCLWGVVAAFAAKRSDFEAST